MLFQNTLFIGKQTQAALQTFPVRGDRPPMYYTQKWQHKKQMWAKIASLLLVVEVTNKLPARFLDQLRAYTIHNLACTSSTSMEAQEQEPSTFDDAIQLSLSNNYSITKLKSQVSVKKTSVLHIKNIFQKLSIFPIAWLSLVIQRYTWGRSRAYQCLKYAYDKTELKLHLNKAFGFKCNKIFNAHKKTIPRIYIYSTLNRSLSADYKLRQILRAAVTWCLLSFASQETTPMTQSLAALAWHPNGKGFEGLALC